MVSDILFLYYGGSSSSSFLRCAPAGRGGGGNWQLGIGDWHGVAIGVLGLGEGVIE